MSVSAIPCLNATAFMIADFADVIIEPVRQPKKSVKIKGKIHYDTSGHLTHNHYIACPIIKMVKKIFIGRALL